MKRYIKAWEEEGYGDYVYDSIVDEYGSIENYRKIMDESAEREMEEAERRRLESYPDIGKLLVQFEISATFMCPEELYYMAEDNIEYEDIHLTDADVSIYLNEYCNFEYLGNVNMSDGELRNIIKDNDAALYAIYEGIRSYFCKSGRSVNYEEGKTYKVEGFLRLAYLGDPRTMELDKPYGDPDVYYRPNEFSVFKMIELS